MAVVAAAAASVPSVYSACRASWDMNPIPKPNKFSHPSKGQRPSSSPAPQSSEMVATATLPAAPMRKEELPATQLWNSNPNRSSRGKADELYLGLEKWLPAPPKVKKPRSIYNAASLAYLGDGIYELYARRHFLYPPKSIDVYNERVMAIVRCEAQARILYLYLYYRPTITLSSQNFQDALLKKLMSEDYLTEEERDILRWGKNVASGKTKTKKRAGVQVYSRASSLETLIGFLYLTNVKRLEDLMRQLGFSTCAAASSPDQIASHDLKSELL